MKTRNGFVSNSSSSSFIVGFKTIPSSPEELKGMMFSHKYEDVKMHDFEKPISTLDIANIVFSDLKSGKQIHKKQALNLILEGYFPGDLPYDWNENTLSEKYAEDYEAIFGYSITNDKASKSDYKRYIEMAKKERNDFSKIRKAVAKAFLEGFWPRVKGMKVFKFEYCDNEGYSVLEHGNIFKKFPHVRINKH